jgi:large subunit ribosomal protein L7/L12
MLRRGYLSQREDVTYRFTMTIVDTSTRLPTTPGPYAVLVKPAQGYHRAIETGVSWDGSWKGTDDPVVAWVDTAARVAVVPSPTQAVEPSSYSLTLVGFDPTSKIGVIKLVRELTGLGLAESKATVEALAIKPLMIKENASRAEVTALDTRLRAAGGVTKLEAV